MNGGPFAKELLQFPFHELSNPSCLLLASDLDAQISVKPLQNGVSDEAAVYLFFWKEFGMTKLTAWK
jgi:hypothetical protein